MHLCKSVALGIHIYASDVGRFHGPSKFKNFLDLIVWISHDIAVMSHAANRS